MAEAALEVAVRQLLLRVGARQRRVDIEHGALRAFALARDPPLGARPQPPRPRARDRDRRAQALKAPLVDRVDHPKRRRVRRHLTEQVDLVAQRAHVRQAVAAVGEHHRQVTQHHPGVVRRAPLPRRRHRRRQRPRQPNSIRRPRQQRAARMPHLTGSVRGND